MYLCYQLAPILELKEGNTQYSTYRVIHLLLLSLCVLGSNLTYTSTNKLLDSNVDLEGSYKCNANQEIKFNSSATDQKISVTLEIMDLQVQAYFKEHKDTFDAGRIDIFQLKPTIYLA